MELDFWRGPSYVDRPVDVMIPPQLNHTFDKIFEDKLLQRTVLIEDLENDLIEDRAARPSLKPKPQRQDIVERHFDEYQRLPKIHSFLDTIVSKNTGIASVETIGTSYEGRPIKIIRIGDGNEKKNKPIIFIESGIHAREWISPATTQCFGQYLVQGYKARNSDITALLQKFDFYILPVLNPDGYEHTHTRDRMWRKTRKPYGNCMGADPNRNFGYQWGGQGASTNPCSETYRGPSAFSEPETKAVSDYVLRNKDRIKAYLAVHSYGQYFLYPWMRPPVEQMVRYYWAYGSAHIKYSYTVELRDTGSYGFALPKSHIRPVCEETTVAFIAFAKELAKEV
ncbi:unnamed protein product [Medioppia subpectinata]|uniref:Peptidase M14 domain-containing protein n=1 Tax=Medioppia subpectinata TaxID=1979941 RepID=A0A7R9KEB5_9ACAR|nr:unnamed protein product [Medioppia subpectinata]CAG2101594.1 unnamed protein product [Medioppia subpectinata]